ncbi:MAG: YhjD/YihY/BrkB family envelope integrity protein [Polyangiaceae bacterium]
MEASEKASEPVPASILSVAFGRSLLRRLGGDRTLSLAADMAFWLFLSLLPLAAVGGMIVAKIFATGYGAGSALLSTLPRSTSEIIERELARMAAWNGGQVGVGAALVFVWLASSGVASVFEGVEVQSDAKPRSWIHKRVLAVATCVALSVGVAAVTSLFAGFGWLWALAGQSAERLAALESGRVASVARAGLGASIWFGLMCGLYWVALPSHTRRLMPIVPGALVAVALQVAVGAGYRLYLVALGDGGAYQAGLASIGVTLMGLYLLCISILVGIEFNQMLGERKRAALVAKRVSARRERRWGLPAYRRV